MLLEINLQKKVEIWAFRGDDEPDFWGLPRLPMLSNVEVRFGTVVRGMVREETPKETVPVSG